MLADINMVWRAQLGLALALAGVGKWNLYYFVVCHEMCSIVSKGYFRCAIIDFKLQKWIFSSQDPRA
jgi:hypothetical protein